MYRKVPEELENRLQCLKDKGVIVRVESIAIPIIGVYFDNGDATFIRGERADRAMQVCFEIQDEYGFVTMDALALAVDQCVGINA